MKPSLTRRAAAADRLIDSIRLHSLQEQADAIGTRRWGPDDPQSRERPQSDTDDPYGRPDPDSVPVDLGHSDPTPTAAAITGHFAKQDRAVRAAENAVHKAFDDLSATCKSIIARKPGDIDLSAEPRCPGWTAELRARLGGCSRHLEPRKRPDGTVSGLRSLCVGCRSAKTRAARAGRALGLCEEHVTQWVDDHADGRPPDPEPFLAVGAQCEQCRHADRDRIAS